MTEKMPVPMTPQQMIRQLILVLEKSTPEEREQFKQSWLESLPRFNAETKRIRRKRFKAHLSDNRR